MADEFLPDTQVGPSVSDGEGGEVIEFALGFDPDADLTVLMAVMLTATDRDDTLEFSFGIRTRVGDGPASPPDFGKEAVDRYIPKDSRPKIKDLIGLSAIWIATAALPNNIVMETFYPSLDAKALRKYEIVIRAFEICGYKLVDQFRDSSDDKDYWSFSRLADLAHDD